MRSPASSVADVFDSKVHRLAGTRARADALRALGALSVRDLEEIYRGLFLGLVVTFERSVEDLFIGLLAEVDGYRTADPSVKARVRFRSRRVLWDSLLGEAGKRESLHLDWLPYSKTTKRAAVYFRGGRPFSYLTDPSQPTNIVNAGQMVQKSIWIRNALAHSSRASLNTFQTKVLPANIRPPERTPSRFLMGQQTPGETRFQTYSDQLALALRTLAR